MVSTPRISSISTAVKEIVPASIKYKKADPEETLNLLYKTLPAKTTKLLENFTGEREISVYRGENYMNKITKRLKEPFLIFIRNMKNIGTSSNPKMANQALVLNFPNKYDALEIYYRVPGDSEKGVYINLYRQNFIKTVRRYANFAELRNDTDIISVVEGWLGKKLK